MNFNEFKPRRWISADEFPDDKIAFDYWMNVAQQFPDISLDFLKNDDFSIEVVSESESEAPLSSNQSEEILGIDEFIENDIEQKNKKLFIPETEFKKDLSDNQSIYSPKLSEKLNCPYILLQYYNDKPIDFLSFQTQNEFNNLEESQINSRSEKNDLQAILPTYSIEKRILNETKDAFPIDDLKYTEIAQGVSKRYITPTKELGDSVQNSLKINEKKMICKKIATDNFIENNISKNDKKFISHTDIYKDQQILDNIDIQIDDCFQIGEIIFFSVSAKSKSNNHSFTENNNNSQKICVPESIMKKHFPNALLDYYEKCIVFST